MDWLALIGVLLGGGAVGAIANGLFNRCKVKAEADAIGAKSQVDSFMALITSLENRLEKQENRIDALEKELKNKIMIIEKLTIENQELHSELKKVKDQNERLMKTNRDLTARVSELEKRLARFNNQDVADE